MDTVEQAMAHEAEKRIALSKRKAKSMPLCAAALKQVVDLYRDAEKEFKTVGILDNGMPKSFLTMQSEYQDFIKRFASDLTSKVLVVQADKINGHTFVGVGFKTGKDQVVRLSIEKFLFLRNQVFSEPLETFENNVDATVIFTKLVTYLAPYFEHLPKRSK